MICRFSKKNRKMKYSSSFTKLH